MEAEQEKWLAKCLKEGVEVQELFPHMFAKKFAYYDIVIFGKKIGVIVEVKREEIKHINTEPLKMQISKVFQIVRGEKEEIKYSNLINKYITFVPQRPKFKTQECNPFLLSGKFFLD